MSTNPPPELHEGRDEKRELYKLVNWLRRRLTGFQGDSTSLHFYVNDATAPTGSSGYLSPTDSVPLNVVGGIYYSLSTDKVFTRGTLEMRIINNTMTGVETYSVTVQGNISGPASAGITATSGSSGTLTAEFTTGSTSSAEVYLLQVSSNANSKTVQFSLVWRMYEG